MNIKYPLESVHTLSVEEVMTAFETNAQKGIGAAEAETRTAKFGANIYAAQKQKSIWLMLLLQFKSPIVYLLLFAVAVTLYFQNYIEAIAIGVVIFVNALIGFFMELQARSSMNALKEMDVILSNVIRDGKTLQIPSEKITVGDLVV
ncbi:MAG: ATPase, partial [Ferruginibacter sp.]|nr:ATPase [Ferruginibacter sp.]